MSTLAVIELGSGSTRMLIDGGHHSGVRHHVVTRMAEGLANTGHIGSDALGRVRLALQKFRSLCEEAEVDEVIVIATQAARVASNVDEVEDLVADEFNTTLSILSAEEEGRSAFSGATSNLPDDSMVLLLDIGGASTEFVVGVTGTDRLDVLSSPVGAVSITEQYIESDPPDPGELSSALSVISTYIDDVIRHLPTVPNASDHGTVVAVGGTVTTTAAVELGLATYDSDAVNGFKLEREAVEDVFRTLATESNEDRAFNPGLEEDRVSLIVGGLCVLVAIMRHLLISDIIVSDNDVLDGIVAERRA